jgi:hypothetical protein
MSVTLIPNSNNPFQLVKQFFFSLQTTAGTASPNLAGLMR